jgi:NAD(P)-dependent dehydrogenase (short-subunit alcohol dehydrogenase family)
MFMWTTADMPAQAGKTALVTGANTGIGYETALALYRSGAEVLMAGRDEAKLEAAKQRILEGGGSGRLQIVLLDLASLDSVRQCAARIVQQFPRLDVLINNAGVMRSPRAHTAEGFELQFGTNFIGHFVLTALLYPALQAAPAARVVTLSSLAYLTGSIDFDNLRAERDYDPAREYAQSKLADLFLSLEMQRRLEKAGSNVVSIAAQPGANNTELARHMPAADYAAALERFGTLMEPWQGALPSLYAATAPEAIPGALYGPDEAGIRGYPAQDQPKPHALDAAVAQRLWTIGEAALRTTFL